MEQVIVLLTDGFADWETAFLTGIGGPFYGLTTRTVSPAGKPITSQGGLRVTPDGAFEDLDPASCSVLAICGGRGWVEPGAIDIGPQAAAILAAGKSLAAICGGTLALARTGLLAGHRHTSNDRAFLADHAKGYAGVADYVESRVAIVDARIITAPGTAPASFTAEVFRAAGVEETNVVEFLGMVGAEHAVVRTDAAAGTIEAVSANLSCRSLEVSLPWFSALFAKPPTRLPMAGLAEWAISEHAQVQLYAAPEHAGHGTLTISVTDLTAERKRLAQAGLKPGVIEQADYLSLVRLRDPDGNLVVLVGDKRD